jgi:MFS family permease
MKLIFMASYGRVPPQQGPYQSQSPYPISRYPNMLAPPPAPYYLPPYYPTPTLSHGPPMHVLDQQLNKVPFKFRPRAYKIALCLLIIGVVICLGWVGLMLTSTYYFGIISIIFILFLAIGSLGIVSIILLLIPKKIGWYFAFITSCLALAGLGIGTIIGMYLMVCLMWPSVRYYFHSGQYPPLAPISTLSGFQGPPGSPGPPRLQKIAEQSHSTRFRD